MGPFASSAEVGDETHSFDDARNIESGDVYLGHLNRVDDRADYFVLEAIQHQIVNVHIYVKGHDGTDEWLRPTITTPPSPPDAIHPSTSLDCFLYHAPDHIFPLDGACNYYYVRDYVLNICAPIPGTNTYYLNVSIDWAWTPNNFTWDYLLELNISTVPIISSGQTVSDTIVTDTRDTHWYKVWAKEEQEVNGSFDILSFDTDHPDQRNIDIWVFPDDLGGYPRSLAWDWSAAPNQPVEPFSILATYSGWYFIKLRAMNHVKNLPCSYRLEMYIQDVPEFPETGAQGNFYDRFRHDTDWYKFDMKANLPHPDEAGLWNEVCEFNMTELADTGERPDFDLYLFGQVPGSRLLDILDSSFNSDHCPFDPPLRDPNLNFEHVRAAAFYNGTYFLEINAFNNTGSYDLRMDWQDLRLSDGDNLPGEARRISAGVYEGHVHQAFDHYDWCKVTARSYLRIQLDIFKAIDLYNASVFKYDPIHDEYVVIGGGWNTWFNFTTRKEHLSNLIDFEIDLTKFGGAGTCYISVTAAVATMTAADHESWRRQIFICDDDATTDYELRVWADGTYRPPLPQFRRIPDLYIEEDTDKLEYIDLDDYFVDYDVGDDDLKYRVSIKRGKLERIILDTQNWTLGFEAFPDFTGKVTLTITAIDRHYLQSLTEWIITFTPVNDAPRLLVPVPHLVNTTEDHIHQMDLRELVHDVDDGDTLTVTFDPPEHLDIHMDPDTLETKITFDTDWSGEAMVVFKIVDIENASVDLPVQFVVSNVPDAPRLVKSFGTIVIDEDTSAMVVLSDYIFEPDGDQLDVAIDTDEDITSEWDQRAGVLTLAPVPNWFGIKELLVQVADPEGHQLTASIFLDVLSRPDPPLITAHSPTDLEISIAEGTERPFVMLEVVDPDSGAHLIRWHLDGGFVGSGKAWTYRPGKFDQGRHVVTLLVIDERGLCDEVTWMVNVIDVPHPPEGGIASPPDGSLFLTGDLVTFVALFHDPDGDAILYRWYIDGEVVSYEPTFVKRLEAGDHTITLETVSDGHVVTDEVTILVMRGDEEGHGWVIFAGPFVLAFTFSAAFLAARRLRSMKGQDYTDKED